MPTTYLHCTSHECKRFLCHSHFQYTATTISGEQRSEATAPWFQDTQATQAIATMHMKLPMSALGLVEGAKLQRLSSTSIRPSLIIFDFFCLGGGSGHAPPFFQTNFSGKTIVDCLGLYVKITSEDDPNRSLGQVCMALVQKTTKNGTFLKGFLKRLGKMENSTNSVLLGGLPSKPLAISGDSFLLRGDLSVHAREPKDGREGVFDEKKRGNTPTLSFSMFFPAKLPKNHWNCFVGRFLSKIPTWPCFTLLYKQAKLGFSFWAS